MAQNCGGFRVREGYGFRIGYGFYPTETTIIKKGRDDESRTIKKSKSE